MILYFVNKQANVLGFISNTLKRNGLYFFSDSREDDIKTGSQTLSFTIKYTTRYKKNVEFYTEIGNGIIVGNSSEFYTVTETEHDWFAQEIDVYAESAGLSLLNMMLESASAPSSAQNFKYYFDKFFSGTGWRIGINELADEKKKLEFDEESGSARLQNLVSAFGGEIGYTFGFRNNKVEASYVNVYQARGSVVTKYLKLGEDINKLLVKKSGADLVTAIKATGKNNINLKYSNYDDGDLYLENGVLYSRSAVARWGTNGTHIQRSMSFDTASTANLLTMARRQLSEWQNPLVTYEAETAEGVTDLVIGDNVVIQDLTGKTAYRTRVVGIVKHDDRNMLEVTFGDYVSLVGEDVE